MKIDLNNNDEFTLENVRRLIASGSNTENTQLRVNKDGIAYLSKTVGNIKIDDLAFCLETWIAGNSYAGAEAAADTKWVTTVYSMLKENWPHPRADFIDQ